MINIKKPDFISVKLPKKIFIPIISILTIFLFYHSLFLGRIYPGVYIAGINVSGKTPEEAVKFLQENLAIPKEISLVYKDQTYSIPVTTLNVNYDLTQTTQRAFQLFRSPSVENLIFSLTSSFKKTNVPLVTVLDKDKLNQSLLGISGGIAQEPVYPSIYLLEDKLIVEKGLPGYEIDEEKIVNDIVSSLSLLNNSRITISTIKIDPTLSDIQASILYDRGNKLLEKNIVLTFEFQEFFYSKDSILSLLDPSGGYNLEKISTLVNDVSVKIDRKPQNPVFVFMEGKVQAFAPAKDGIEIKKNELIDKINLALNKIETTDRTSVSIAIPTTNTPSEYKIADVNNLGIKELVGRGVSHFTGSIASRIHNISLASSKFNGILIAPGDTFSFNNTLGDVSAFTGYQQAYIIQDGKTVLGDGGGVCQVSTTLFRAALNAGLPIIERRAHSYRVGYYEQGFPVGLDATVFSPTTDLKIKNDTPAHLLIQTSVDTKTKTLIFEIYGTSDGRTATISKSSITGVTPPPEDLYIDDPTLPAGTVKQIDWKAWGSKVSFQYTVIRNEETLINKTFYSNYQPWQAKFLRGTGPAE
jgi:vancomycin resistance protein YoaR